MKSQKNSFCFMGTLLFAVAVITGSAILTGCSTAAPVKQQQYAQLNDHRDFEYDFPTVWRGIENSLYGYTIVDRNPNKVDANEMRKIRERSLTTDWIFARSTEKYSSYQVNGSPRKIYLQMKTRYHIVAHVMMGGTTVSVKPEQMIEKLNPDGSPNGYDTVDEVDRSLANAMLDKIQQAILSAAPSPDVP